MMLFITNSFLTCDSQNSGYGRRYVPDLVGKLKILAVLSKIKYYHSVCNIFKAETVSTTSSPPSLEPTNDMTTITSKKTEKTQNSTYSIIFNPRNQQSKNF